jgi:GH15 family glucan-1,4-alpha-glucosidase
MPRDLAIGNGSMLVNFDAHYQLRDVYFPHVGQENHTLGNPCRLGLWVDGTFTWMSDWALDLRYQQDTMVTDVCGQHRSLSLTVRVNDAVDCNANLLIRRITLGDTNGTARKVRVFAHFDPHISESPYANAAYFDGEQSALVFYKGDRYLLLSSRPAPIEYAVGKKGTEQYQGTWLDAEDGQLSNSAISSGSVDATLMFELDVPAGGQVEAFLWLVAGQSFDSVVELHHLARRAPGVLLGRTAAYWRYWLSRSRRDFGDLAPAVGDLYRRSLLIIRSQIDSGGAIIAGNDGDTMAFGMDHYSYVWPRDAALVGEALNLAGYHEAPRRFYVFLQKLLAQANYALTGYLLHRYTPTGLAAASWHPSVGEGRLLLPIQEDETALVVYGLCQHLALAGEVELLCDLVWKFVRPAADFLLIFRDPETGLPRASHDLWEEKHGIFLFTCSTVFAALEAAAGLFAALGEPALAKTYRAGAREIRAGVSEHFYDPESDRFVSMLHVDSDGALLRDPLLDSSMAGVFIFGLFPADDARVVNTMRALQRELGNDAPVGGIARHSDDYYYHQTGDYADYPGNTWFVSTLWMADWLTQRGHLGEAKTWIEWCTQYALPSGTLAEQLHPHTGAPLSVSPLTWSHAAFVSSVERYMHAYTNHT